MKTTKPKDEKRISRKRIVFTVCGGIIACLVGWYWYSSTHPLSNAMYGFQFYRPTYLPAGMHITEKRIDILRPDGEFLGIQAEMNFRTVDWVYAIQESRASTNDSPLPDTITTTLHNYDPASNDFTCEQQLSPKGQSYRLCHSVDYGKIGVFEVNFVKGGTYIGTRFPTAVGRTIPLDQINTYVDSFVKAKASGFTLLQGGI